MVPVNASIVTMEIPHVRSALGLGDGRRSVMSPFVTVRWGLWAGAFGAGMRGYSSTKPPVPFHQEQP